MYKHKLYLFMKSLAQSHRYVAFSENQIHLAFQLVHETSFLTIVLSQYMHS